MAGNSVFPNKNDFSAGEISARLRLRHDTDIFRRGVRHATNMIPDPMGSIKRRGGTQLIRDFETSGKRLPLEIDYYENIVPSLGKVKDPPGGILVNREEGGPGEILYDNRDHALYFLEKAAFSAVPVARLNQLRDTNYVAVFELEREIYLVTKDGAVTRLGLDDLEHITVAAPPPPAMRITDMTAESIDSNRARVTFRLVSDLGATRALVEYAVRATATTYTNSQLNGFTGERVIAENYEFMGAGPFITARVRHYNEWAASSYRYVRVANPLVIFRAPTIEIQSNLRTQVTLDWNLVFGADQYEFRWRETNQEWSDWCPAYVSNARGVADIDRGTDGNQIEVEVRAGRDGIFSSVAGEMTVPARAGSTLDTWEVIIGRQDQEGNIAVRWSTVTDSGGNDTILYRVRWGLETNPLGPWCFTDQETFLIDDLAEGLRYTVEAQARTLDTDWTDPADPIETVIPIMGDPPSVVNLTAIPSDSKIDLSWPEIEDNGQPLTSLILQYRLLGQPNYIEETLDTTARSYELSGLVNDRAYQVRLRAANLAGASVSPVISATPFRSDAPILPIPDVAPGEEALFVTWDAIDDGGQDLEDVSVQYRRTETENWINIEVGLTDSSHNITGLIASASYDVRLCATNSVGTAYSQVVRGVPAARKTAPIVGVVTAVGGIGSISVTWPAVADGGDTVTGLVLQYRVTGTNTWREVTLAVTDRARNLTSLAELTVYDVRLCATNSIGTTYSAIVTSATLRNPQAPVAPTITAVGATESINVKWPAFGDGGSPVTFIAVQYKRPTDSDWVSITLIGSTAAGARTITGLAALTVFQVRLCAENAIGTSYSNVVEAIPVRAATAPIVPTLSVSEEEESLRYSWGVIDAGGSALTGLVLQYRAKKTGTPNEWRGAAQQLTSRSHTVTRLTAGTTYEARLCATNAVGTSYSRIVEGTPEEAATAPIISGFSVSSGDERITTTWDAIDDGGSPLTRLEIQWKNATQSWNFASTTNLQLSARTRIITGLTNGTDYDVRLCATNAVGTAYSSEIEGTPEAAATAPVMPALSVAAGRAQFSASWGAIDNGGSVLTRLVLQFRTSGSSTWQERSLAINDRSETISGLRGGLIYQVRLCGTNQVGTSYTATQSVTTIQLRGRPIVPTPVLNESNNGIVAFWSSVDANGAALSALNLWYRVDGGPYNAVRLTTSARTYTLTRGLSVGSTYEVHLRATNSEGTTIGDSASIELSLGTLVESGTITVGQGSRDSGSKYISGYGQRLQFLSYSGFYNYAFGSYSVTTNDTVISVQAFGGGKHPSRRSSSPWHGDIVLFMPRGTANSNSIFRRVRLTRGSNSIVLERSDAGFTSSWRPPVHIVPGGSWVRWKWEGVDRSSLIFPESGRATVEVEFYR